MPTRPALSRRIQQKPSRKPRQRITTLEIALYVAVFLLVCGYLYLSSTHQTITVWLW